MRDLVGGPNIPLDVTKKAKSPKIPANLTKDLAGQTATTVNNRRESPKD
jgi:hypothetical protein